MSTNKAVCPFFGYKAEVMLLELHNRTTVDIPHGSRSLRASAQHVICHRWSSRVAFGMCMTAMCGWMLVLAMPGPCIRPQQHVQMCMSDCN